MNALGQIYQFDYDFVRSHGASIVLWKRGLSFHDISQVQWQMIRNCQITGHLPLHIEEVDFEVFLTYSFNGKKMLSKELQTKTWTQEECMHLLLQITSILKDSSKYMLQTCNYVLHPDFLFVDNKDQSIHFVYIPVQAPLYTEPVHKQLKQLTFKMMEHMNHLTGNRIQQLIQIFQKEELSITEIHQSIVNLVQSVDSSRTKSYEKDSSDQKVERAEIQYLVPDEWTDTETMPVDESPPQLVIQKERNGTHLGVKTLEEVQRNVEEEGDLHTNETKERNQDNGWRMAGYVLAVILSALVWRVYWLRTEPAWLYMAVFFTIVLFSIAYVADKWLKRKFSKEQEEMEGIEPLNPWWKGEEDRSNHSEMTQQEQATDRDIHEQSQCGRYQTVNWNDSSNKVKESMVDYAMEHQDLYTEVLTNGEITVMWEEKAMSKSPWIEICENGKMERVELTQTRFVFGRDKESVHYITNSKHASRHHFEIKQEGNDYMLTDLGSSNGTQLNDELLVPYKPTPLQPGDVIRVIDVVITYMP